MSDSCVCVLFVVFFPFLKVLCQDFNLDDALDDDDKKPGWYSRTTAKKFAVENKTNHSVFLKRSAIIHLQI